MKCAREQEFVIGGFTDPEGSRAGLGALLLGVYDGDGALDFAGKVGTGFTDEERARPAPAARRARADGARRSPAKTAGRRARALGEAGARGARSSSPSGRADGRLRHPSFQGLREDKPARRGRARDSREASEEVGPPKNAGARRAREGRSRGRSVGRRRAARRSSPACASPTPTACSIRTSGITKLDLAQYYESASPTAVLPHVQGRPLTLVRCPEGDRPSVLLPEAQRRGGRRRRCAACKIQEKTKVGEYLVVDDLPGLVGLVQMGILEIHTWNSLADDVEQPDRVVFDLDPDTGRALGARGRGGA